LSRSLMDPTIGDLGLIDSVNDLIENINLTRKLHVSLTADPKLESTLTKNHKLTVFRILQEALNNAMKHAKAKTVMIEFKFNRNNIKLTITDDGVGFDLASVKMGAGLKNIQNRVYLLNGTCTIQSDAEKGCKIIINFPIK
jgi:signal transduction histidine kinase